MTWRAVFIGLGAVCAICGLAPYNDFVAENTLLVGNFLPVGLLLIVLALVLVVNAPLRRWRPGWALRQTELAVVLAMALSACAVPSSGLMRYLPSSVVGIYSAAADRPADYGAAVDAARIPEWLLPRSEGVSAADRGGQNVYAYFRARAPDGRVPWAAWVRPVIAWGILIALLYGLVIGLSLVVRLQWTENERLAFPLANVYQSLIEAPAPGYALNTLFRSAGFWIAAGAVFCVHGLNALHANNPNVPQVPLTYDLTDLMADPPWVFTAPGLKTATISFSMIGIAFFVQSKTAFSVWAFFVFWQITEMILGTAEVPFTESMRQDQTFGGLLVFAAVLLYVGRRHWWMVLRHMVGRVRPNETAGKYLPHAASGWLTAGCFVGVVGWLRAVGVSLMTGTGLTLALVLMFMTVARVLAETGLIFVQLNWFPLRGMEYGVLVPTTPHYASSTSFFFSGWLSELFYDLRESLAGFFTTGLRGVDEAVPPDPPRRFGVGLLAAVALALGVGYVVSWTSMLKAEYAYAATTSASAQMVNWKGVDYLPRAFPLDSSVAYQARNVPREGNDWLHRPLTNIGIGAAVVGVCSVLRLMLSWWPLHPAAFVILYSYSTTKVWFSIFLGWLAKLIVLRLGGASLLRRGRSVFIGLIVGEAFAAAFWLVVNLCLNAAGREYKALLFLPG